MHIQIEEEEDEIGEVGEKGGSGVEQSAYPDRGGGGRGDWRSRRSWRKMWTRARSSRRRSTRNLLRIYQPFCDWFNQTIYLTFNPFG